MKKFFTLYRYFRILWIPCLCIEVTDRHFWISICDTFPFANSFLISNDNKFIDENV